MGSKPRWQKMVLNEQLGPVSERTTCFVLVRPVCMVRRMNLTRWCWFLPAAIPEIVRQCKLQEFTGWSFFSEHISLWKRDCWQNWDRFKRRKKKQTIIVEVVVWNTSSHCSEEVDCCSLVVGAAGAADFLKKYINLVKRRKILKKQTRQRINTILFLKIYKSYAWYIVKKLQNIYYFILKNTG